MVENQFSENSDDYLKEEFDRLVADNVVREAVMAMQLWMEIERRRKEHIMNGMVLEYYEHPRNNMEAD